MAKLLKKKIGGSSIVKLLVAGFTKPTAEALIARTPVGNGNFISGATKLFIGGWLIPKFAGNSDIAQGAALGIGVDGVEDIVQQVMKMFTGGTGGLGGQSGVGVI